MRGSQKKNSETNLNKTKVAQISSHTCNKVNKLISNDKMFTYVFSAQQCYLQLGYSKFDKIDAVHDLFEDEIY
jgi:hypothetical protein